MDAQHIIEYIRTDLKNHPVKAYYCDTDTLDLHPRRI